MVLGGAEIHQVVQMIPCIRNTLVIQKTTMQFMHACESIAVQKNECINYCISAQYLYTAAVDVVAPLCEY